MKFKISLSLFLVLAGLLAHAAPPPVALTVAVCNFTGDGAAASYGNNVTTLVTASLATETNLVMVERGQLMKALNEQAFGNSGMVDPETAAKIGQITGAKVLVSGQVLKTGDSHLVIVANIIGTETGRLFVNKVEGAKDNLTGLTSDLSRKIAQTISDQSANLMPVKRESSADRLDRIIKNLGTNRPSVSVNIHLPKGKQTTSTTEAEFGIILMKAGFAVVDANSDMKPDVLITGVVAMSPTQRRGGLHSFRAVVDLKVQERRTGNIIAFDHEVGTATDAASTGANRASQVNAVDALAERILPLLAK